MIHVLFVCLGNICRSPMAEAIFRDLVKKEGLEQSFKVDSAGIGKWHVGNPPHEGTRKLLDRLSISYDGMTARQVVEEDWDTFHYIIAMDEKNMNDLKAIRSENGQVTVARLMDFVKDPSEQNVPDPYFTNNFDYTYELINEGCKELLEKIKQEASLSS